MNFFDHQDQARRNTSVMVGLFALAVLSLIGLTIVLVAVVAGLFFFAQRKQHPEIGYSHLSWQDPITAAQNLGWETFAGIALVVIAVVALASLFKLAQLKGGGKVVAEALGGRLLNLNTRDANEKRLLNVVEEMAIAAGTPVPPVYLIDEPAINAFAAGYGPQDAVIGVTRGTMELLDRDELQGVIAHEFSHILHGDMRLNIRLIGVLHGILILGLIGYFLLRSLGRGARVSSRGRGGGGVAALLALGAGLVVIGYGGTFFGNLIKSAVSRQREFLADASAVQFTRDPGGISGALKKIGGSVYGSRLQHPRANEVSHLFFGQGVKTAFAGLFATHPPLKDRIKRIDPRWNGYFPSVQTTAAATASVSDTEADATTAGATPANSDERFQTAAAITAAAGLAAAPAATALEQVGEPAPEHLDRAKQLLAQLPEDLHQLAHEPYGARALVYGLLLDGTVPVREQQMARLAEHADPDVYALTGQLAERLFHLDPALRLPLVDLALPALKQLSDAQYRQFKGNLKALIEADQRISTWEWVLHRVLLHHLDANFQQRRSQLGSKHQKLAPVKTECELLLAALARAGDGDARAAYGRGALELGLDPAAMPDAEALTIKALDRAVTSLNRVAPLLKPRLLKACCRVISADGAVAVAEAELLRAVADSLDCPMPPVLPGQALC